MGFQGRPDSKTEPDPQKNLSESNGLPGIGIGSVEVINFEHFRETRVTTH